MFTAPTRQKEGICPATLHSLSLYKRESRSYTTTPSISSLAVDSGMPLGTKEILIGRRMTAPVFQMF